MGVSANWSAIAQTNIPDVVSNHNAGRLPDGRTFLLHNPVVQSKDRRDPLVVSLSSDGYVFNRSFVVASCASAEYRSPEQPDGCKPRNNIARWMPGPQYPQGVVDEGLGVLFVAFSVNKEDIWVKGVQLREM